jgi:hypothetical protein
MLVIPMYDSAKELELDNINLNRKDWKDVLMWGDPRIRDNEHKDYMLLYNEFNKVIFVKKQECFKKEMYLTISDLPKWCDLRQPSFDQVSLITKQQRILKENLKKKAT